MHSVPKLLLKLFSKHTPVYARKEAGRESSSEISSCHGRLFFYSKEKNAKRTQSISPRNASFLAPARRILHRHYISYGKGQLPLPVSLPAFVFDKFEFGVSVREGLKTPQIVMIICRASPRRARIGSDGIARLQRNQYDACCFQCRTSTNPFFSPFHGFLFHSSVVKSKKHAKLYGNCTFSFKQTQRKNESGLSRHNGETPGQTAGVGRNAAHDPFFSQKTEDI